MYQISNILDSYYKKAENELLLFYLSGSLTNTPWGAHPEGSCLFLRLYQPPEYTALHYS